MSRLERVRRSEWPARTDGVSQTGKTMRSRSRADPEPRRPAGCAACRWWWWSARAKPDKTELTLAAAGLAARARRARHRRACGQRRAGPRVRDALPRAASALAVRRLAARVARRRVAPAGAEAAEAHAARKVAAFLRSRARPLALLLKPPHELIDTPAARAARQDLGSFNLAVLQARWEEAEI
jgi:hypothetical protein